MSDSAANPQKLQPSAQMRALDRLVGTWKVSDGAQGTVTYEWMEGGFFLNQRVELEQEGQRISGFELIGHLYNPFVDEAPSQDIKSRFYDNQGNTLDYTYELDGDTLTIWAGEKGSPAYFTGTLTDTTLSGHWVYPGGGGYESTTTRIA